MNLFINIHDRVLDRDLTLNMTTVETYEAKDIEDLDGTIHICIIYRSNNGLIFEEEFNSDSDRQDKLDELDSYLA